MTKEELDNKIAFEEDPESWMDEAERSFQERADIIEAVLDGKMGPENLIYSDLVILELRTMEALRKQYLEQGTHAVMEDTASNYYN